tara:strand:- start:123 stop:2891 length:2769 start_codon:yes stop_codon:yes gene_type:complete
MAENEVIFDPSSEHPTGNFSTRIVNSQYDTASAQGIKVGHIAGTHNFVTIIYGRLPEKYDVFGTEEGAVYDDKAEIVNLKLTFTVTGADTDTEIYHIKKIKDGQTTNYPLHDAYAEGTTIGNATYRYVMYDTSNSGAGQGWYTGSAYNSIVTSGVIDGEPIDIFRPDAAGAVTLDLKSYVDSSNVTWGDRFCLILEKDLAPEDANKFFEVDTSTGGYANRTTNNWCDLTIVYEDPEPTAPVTSLSADVDYIGAVITLDTKPSERDIVSFDTVWKAGAADTTTGKRGVDYNTNATYRAQDFTLSGTTLKQNDSQITATYLATEGQLYSAVVYATDSNGKSMGNVMQHTRMSCTGSISPSPPTIGQEATLTISGFSDAGNSSAKSFKKYGVNWNGEATASNDNINDYTIVTLDSEVTSTTVKHTFDKAGTYKVNVCVIDEKGFRTDFTQAASITVADVNPVAVLKASRDTAVRARYGDEFSVMTLSAAQSYPVGSDRIIMAHKFKHDSSDFPLTTFPMDNDNSSFNEVSRAIALKCNVANCDDTVLKVFGKVSVSSDGTPNPDHDEFFDRYEYQVHDLSPHANIDTFGAMATTGGEAVYWKSVDFVVVSSLDAQDTGAVYTLADIKHDHNSGDAADAGYGNIINNKIRAARNTYAWGGYIESGTIQCDFTASTKTIHNDTGNTFITAGFVPGDTIYIEGAVADIANNGFFTIASMDDDEIVVNETIVDESNDAGVKIYKINGPTLPIASYLHTTEGTNPTITCSVVSALAESTSSQNLDTSADVTQVVRFESELYNTLDLDTLADAGNIAITSANLSRSGGINSLMPIGGGAYPVGTTRTTMGTPTLNVSVRTLTQAGYRSIWSLIEGGRYEWVTIDSKQVDAPGTAYKQLRLRLSNGSLTKNPELASEYEASLSFIVIGELVS